MSSYRLPWLPPAASRDRAAWDEFASGDSVRPASTSYVKDWFRSYNKDSLDHIPATEEYLPVPSMGTLVVVLSIPEDELYDVDDDE
jgi:hypothetical protein